MPKDKLPKGEKLVSVPVMVQEKKRDFLTYKECQRIGKAALDAAFEQALNAERLTDESMDNSSVIKK